MLEESYRSGHQEFDFSIGLEPYKYYFATHVRAIGPRGKPPIAQQLKQLAKAAIKRNPWLYERVKALRGRQDPQS
jgi:CelD/BcsL family acetyltransferase involved in cellulose biosynthesis